MTYYFNDQELNVAKKARNKFRFIYIAVVIFYAILTVGFMLWFKTLPYKSPTITKIKLIHYPITFVFVVFSFIYLFIVYKGARRYFKLVHNMVNGIREKSSGSFLEYSEKIQNKDGVDMKALVFIEWNKYKKDYFERKVLVFADKPFPEIPKDKVVNYVTQSNVLISYEIEEE